MEFEELLAKAEYHAAKADEFAEWIEKIHAVPKRWAIFKTQLPYRAAMMHHHGSMANYYATRAAIGYTAIERNDMTRA